MNKIYYQIKKNIEKMYKSGEFQGKYIILFGANKPSERIILLLKEKGIKVNSIIDNNHKKTGKMMLGIRVDTPETILPQYSDNAIILIGSVYFYEMKKQLLELNCKKHQIFRVVTYHKLSCSSQKFKRAEKEVYQGEKIYQRLLNIYGNDTKIIMCPYNCVGDIYVILSYLDEYCKKEKIEKFVITAIGNHCKKIGKIFDVHQIEILSQLESDCLMEYTSFLGQKETNVAILTHALVHWDILRNFELSGKMDWGTMFRYILMKTKDTPKRNFYISDELKKQTDEFFNKNNLIQQKAAIISPYSNTLDYISDDIWDNIVKILKEKGYIVYTNSIGDREPALSGTLPLFFPLEIAKEVIERIGLFIGSRSGLCDIIESAKAKIFILYPDAKDKFFNLKSLGFGENVIECYYKEDNIIKIIDKNI